MAKTIIVNTPSSDGRYDYWMEKTLLNVCTRLAEQGITSIRDWSIGPNIAINRNHGVYHAKKNDASHILWIDSDVVMVDPETVTKMLAHDKDIVSACVYGKQPPFVPIAAKWDGERYVNFTQPLEKGLVEVDGVGGGCLLVKASVFDSISYPYFNFDTVFTRGENTPVKLKDVEYGKTQIKLKEAARKIADYQREHPCDLMSVPWLLLRPFIELTRMVVDGNEIGEDYGFCRKAQAAGFTIWMDTTIPIGHCGRYMFNETDNLNEYRRKQHAEQPTSPILQSYN